MPRSRRQIVLRLAAHRLPPFLGVVSSFYRLGISAKDRDLGGVLSGVERQMSLVELSNDAS